MSALLDFVTFQELSNWSVAHLLQNHFNYNQSYPLVKIGSFLKRNKTSIDIDDDTIYKRVTIKLYNNGVFLRDTEIGKNIGTKKQFVIKKGQFLLSKIDARNGAFGLATEEVDGAIVTQDFLAFDVDTDKIDPYFLVYLTTTKKFMQFAQSASSGTTGRQRIDINKFLDTKIPLPSLEDQQRIVNNYQTKISKAEVQEQEVKELERNIDTYIFQELGIEQESIMQENHTEILNFLKFKDMLNWSFNSSNKTSINSYKYPIYKLQDIANIGSGGTPSRSKADYYKNGTIPWVKTGEVRDNIIYSTEESITLNALASSSAKLYPINSLIIAMYGATAGRTAKLGIEASTNQACAVLYNIRKNIVCTDFLWFYLMSQLENFKSLSEGSAQPNLNSNKIKTYKIPLPPIEIQNQIVKHIKMTKETINNLNDNIQRNRLNAIVEFESEIFNEA